MLRYRQEELTRAGHDRRYRLSAQVTRKYSVSQHAVMVAAPTASPSNHGDMQLARDRTRVQEDAELLVAVVSLVRHGVSSTRSGPRRLHLITGDRQGHATTPRQRTRRSEGTVGPYGRKPADL